MPEWEQIVVDDGSTDQTASIAESFGDARVRVVRQENRGLARLGETYNRALEMAQGEYIAILEGDDYWPLNKLEAQLEEFTGPEVALCSGFFRVVDEEGNSLGLEPMARLETPHMMNRPVGYAALKLLDPKCFTFVFPVTLLIRKAALDRIGGFQQPDYLPLVDYPTVLNLALVGEWRWLDVISGYWRRHGQSTTSSRTSSILSGAMRYGREFIDAHRSELPASEEQWLALERERSSFQHERAMIAHRWAQAEGKRGQAAQLLEAAGSMPIGRKAKARVSMCRLMMSFGLSTEPVAGLQRRPWKELARINDYDSLVSPDMDPAELTYV
jgi:glycosyltransferase involved in cell wall biosynthesis